MKLLKVVAKTRSYVNGGYTYRKDNVKGIRYLRYSEFKVGSPGRGKISSDMI